MLFFFFNSYTGMGDTMLNRLNEYLQDNSFRFTVYDENIHIINFERIITGFKEVMNRGTGSGYTAMEYKPAGKTGTSEVVYNKDLTTINQTYAMFGPYDDPQYSIVVVTPNVSYNNDRDNYIAPVNRLISKEVSAYVFGRQHN